MAELCSDDVQDLGDLPKKISQLLPHVRKVELTRAFIGRVPPRTVKSCI